MKATISIHNHRRYERKVINGLAAFALLLTGVPGAEAEDEKIFPGTMCVQEGVTSTVLYTAEGRVLNPSTTAPVTVNCPIVRDTVLERWDSVNVVVADRNLSGDISCTAISAQTDGLFGGFNPETQETSGGSFDPFDSVTLTFGPPAQERDRGTYFLRCTIPPREAQAGVEPSGIYSYRIDEP
jgi:hypothetical protein